MRQQARREQATDPSAQPTRRRPEASLIGGAHIHDYGASLATREPSLAALDHALVQFRRTVADRRSSQEVHEVASDGFAGASEPLPHLAAIQRAFGHHDISSVRAFRGGEAREACDQLGAHAYAMDGQVAMGPTGADLHTAAHEAAHVVQQRAGVHLKDGVGQNGDIYERHADAVADRVVQGESAVELLDQVAATARSAGNPAVQLDAMTCGDVTPRKESSRKAKAAIGGTSKNSKGNPLHKVGLDSGGTAERCMDAGVASGCIVLNGESGELGGKFDVKVPLGVADVTVGMKVSAFLDKDPVEVTIQGSATPSFGKEIKGIGLAVKRSIALQGFSASGRISDDGTSLVVDCMEVDGAVTDGAVIGWLEVSDSETRVANLAIITNLQIPLAVGVPTYDSSFDGAGLAKMAALLVAPPGWRAALDGMRAVGGFLDEHIGQPLDELRLSLAQERARERRPPINLAAPPTNQGAQVVAQGSPCDVTEILPEDAPAQGACEMAGYVSNLEGLSEEQANKVALLALHGIDQIPYETQPGVSKRDALVAALDTAAETLPPLAVVDLLTSTEAAINAPFDDSELNEEQRAMLTAAQQDKDAAQAALDRHFELERRVSRGEVSSVRPLEEGRQAAEAQKARAQSHATHADAVVRSQVRAEAFSRGEILHQLLRQGVTEIDVIPGQSLDQALAGYVDGTPRLDHPGDQDPGEAYSGLPNE